VSSPGPVLVEVTRGGHVESVHTGSVLALRDDGTVALALGDVNGLTFPRSSNKPLQAGGLLEQGWEPADETELALACASHSGEPGHLEVVRRMLGDLPESALGCPVSLPYDPAVPVDGPSRLLMNCSGKHAAMLATCVAADWPIEGYLDPVHPLQQALTRTMARLAGEPPTVVVDGCGAPQHGMSLTSLAGAYARLDSRVAAAMRAHPWHVGGTGRDVTALMEQVPGLVAKDGAEGVYAAAVPGVGTVALKIDDGAARARTPVLVSALRALGIEAPAALAALAVLPVLGGEARVGEVRVSSALD
jgi:L-asparaginase II